MADEIKQAEPGGFYRLMAGETPAELLVRIDERTKNTEDDVKEIKKSLEGKYVTLEAFNALKDKVMMLQRIIFTVIGLMCLTVLGALFKLVIAPGTGGT